MIRSTRGNYRSIPTAAPLCSNWMVDIEDAQRPDGSISTSRLITGATQKWIRMTGFLKDDLMPKDTYGDWRMPLESPISIRSQDPNRRTDLGCHRATYFYHLLC
jgi:hypothetical protein